ncbi:MAG: hypothetical protein JSV10_08145 [Candidatus Zixiibacteriota bacterium]|nr:MAG: hypothetical protein JSV10_08145 [candidate division Zixibacteria bacterium]
MIGESDSQSPKEIRMKYLGYLASMMLLCCVTFSCGEKCTRSVPEIVYFISFESAEDTTGWQGITDKMFVRDPAPGAGARSLKIGGGCIQPAAYIDLPPQAGPGNYVISCWGKVPQVNQPGRIVLQVAQEGGEAREIWLRVDSEDWMFYESREPLRCSGDCSLRLQVWIGGFVPANISVDCIKIERVE